jgi:CubicO group peptidase (beta-lactamase class C family)
MSAKIRRIGRRLLKKGPALGAIVTLLLVGSCSSKPFAPYGSLPSFTQYLDARIPQLLARYDVPGVSVALIQEGELVWSGAYGYANLADGRSLTVDDIFRVGSISKSVTAWSVMTLVEQGLVDLDAPVQQYLHTWQLPPSDYDVTEITVRRLLSNSAGLPLGDISAEYDPQGTVPSLQENLAQEAIPFQEPGVGFFYSNTGFNLLELLIEEVTGQDFADYLAQEMLRPLSMIHATFDWDATQHAGMTTGYDAQGNPVAAYVYPAQASGGLLASVADVAHFACAAMAAASDDSGVLSAMSARQLHEPAVAMTGIFGVVADAYGFGHFVERLPNGSYAAWHGGQGHGWMSHFHIIPETGDGIVILTNSQRSWPFMAELLRDWSVWGGFGPVKMARIVTATAVFWALTGLMGLTALWQAYRLLRGVTSGQRRFAPLAAEGRTGRMAQVAAGLGLLALLAWAAAQPYLMVSSIFPTAVPWAGGALLVLALTWVLAAGLPSAA